jgi:hemolysin activation/secretion protein
MAHVQFIVCINSGNSIKGEIMSTIKSKKIIGPLCFCIIVALLTPAVSLAVEETGEIAASQASDQRARMAKKAAERKKAAEEKKAADAKKAPEEPKAAESPKEGEAAK